MTGGLGGPARSPQSSVAFITGLTAEARLLAGLPCIARAGGGTPEGAARQAKAAIRAGARALISFGLAGGLDPALGAGAILRPATVLWRNASFATDADLTAALGGVTEGPMLAAEFTIAPAREKLAAHAGTGAVAVDLESGAVAEIACKHGVPFAVLRAICDTAGENLKNHVFAVGSLPGTPTRPNCSASGTRRPRTYRAKEPRARGCPDGGTGCAAALAVTKNCPKESYGPG
jgi:adenosylhomocysteine nucleosidase